MSAGLGKGSIRNGNHSPEYGTLYNHWSWIFNKTKQLYPAYKNMLFFDAWNPNKGGSFAIGTQWICEHLGFKPGPKFQLHVLKTKKHPHGFFGPGGIVWRREMDRHDQDVLDLVTEWSNKKWREFVDAENRRRRI